jgi:hypothetical protein
MRLCGINWAVFPALLLLSCGYRSQTAAVASSFPSKTLLTERHQILFQNKDDTQVFEGYMMRIKGAYVVQAFAGPGVDLFTVARVGDRHRETLHIKALADKIDVVKIGDDIYRVYMDGCPVMKTLADNRQVSCLLHGQRARESYDADSHLIERSFPKAHGIGLTIRYLEYKSTEGGLLPSRIELRWGNNPDRLMVIRAVSVGLSPKVDDKVFEEALK